MTNELDLEAIRAKAKELGVPVHPAQKAETIQANIDRFLVEAASGVTLPAVAAEPLASVPAVETEAEELARLQAEALALIPVTVTSMDPADAGLTAAIISVGNAKLGQITKAIPFGYKWYMPKILLEDMEERTFMRHAMVPVPGSGMERLETAHIKKYAIQRHPMPTQEELEQLAKAQAMGNELAK